MKTLFDLFAMVIFAGLAVVYLQRSASEEADATPLWLYGLAALACAGGNYLGNNGQGLAGTVILVGAAVLLGVILRPFKSKPSP